MASSPHGAAAYRRLAPRGACGPPQGDRFERSAAMAPLPAFHGAKPPAPPWFDAALADEPERTFIEVEGAKVEDLAWGERGKPGLMFLHGGAAHADWWSFIAPFSPPSAAWSRRHSPAWDGPTGASTTPSSNSCARRAKRADRRRIRRRAADRRRPLFGGAGHDGSRARLRRGDCGRGHGRSAVLRAAEPGRPRRRRRRGSRGQAFARRRRRAFPPHAAAAGREPVRPRRHRPPLGREVVDEHGQAGWALCFDPHFWEKFDRIDPAADRRPARSPLALIRGAKSKLFKADDADYLMSFLPPARPNRHPGGRAPRDDRPAAGVRLGAEGAHGSVAWNPSPVGRGGGGEGDPGFKRNAAAIPQRSARARESRSPITSAFVKRITRTPIGSRTSYAGVRLFQRQASRRGSRSRQCSDRKGLGDETSRRANGSRGDASIEAPPQQLGPYANRVRTPSFPNHRGRSPHPCPSPSGRGVAVHSSLTVTASDAPLASTTVTRAKPAPSGFQADVAAELRFADRRAVDEPGERRDAAERLQREPRVARARRRCRGRSARRPAERRSSAPRVSVAAMVLGASLRRWRSGGGRSAVMARAARPGRRIELDVAPEALERVEQDRRRGLPADEAGRRAVVGPADPDRDGRPLVEADRQRVAKTVGGAGLEGDPAGKRIGRRRRAAQDVGDVPGRDRIGDPARADDRRARRRAARSAPAPLRRARSPRRGARCRSARRRGRRGRSRARSAYPSAARPRPPRRAGGRERSPARRRPEARSPAGSATSATPSAPSPCPGSRDRNSAARRRHSAPAGRTAPSRDGRAPPRRRARR